MLQKERSFHLMEEVLDSLDPGQTIVFRIGGTWLYYRQSEVVHSFDSVCGLFEYYRHPGYYLVSQYVQDGDETLSVSFLGSRDGLVNHWLLRNPKLISDRYKLDEIFTRKLLTNRKGFSRMLVTRRKKRCVNQHQRSL
jgi:hypothetical protein